jgi:hypothetical protein
LRLTNSVSAISRFVIPVCLPAPAFERQLATINPGSAIVGQTGPSIGELEIHVADDRHANAQLFADRCALAAGRMTERYPTSAKLFIPAEWVVPIGEYDSVEGEVQLLGEDKRRAGPLPRGPGRPARRAAAVQRDPARPAPLTVPGDRRALLAGARAAAPRAPVGPRGPLRRGAGVNAAAGEPIAAAIFETAIATCPDHPTKDRCP